MAFAEAPKSILVVGGPIKYYLSYDTAGTYEEKAFGGECHTMTLQNTHASDPVTFSFDGVVTHGELSGGESITVNMGSATSVSIKSTAGNAIVRIWAW